MKKVINESQLLRIVENATRLSLKKIMKENFQNEISSDLIKRAALKAGEQGRDEQAARLNYRGQIAFQKELGPTPDEVKAVTAGVIKYESFAGKLVCLYDDCSATVDGSEVGYISGKNGNKVDTYLRTRNPRLAKFIAKWASKIGAFNELNFNAADWHSWIL